MHMDEDTLNDVLTPTFPDVAAYLKAEFSPTVQLNQETQLAGLLCRSPIGDTEVFVHRSSHAGIVYLEVNMFGLGHVVPSIAEEMTRLIDQINDFGLGGVVMVIDGAIVFRQSIAIEQAHLNCWQSRLRFMLTEGMQMSLRVRLYFSQNLAGVEFDQDDAEDRDAEPTMPHRIDPSWN